MAPNHENNRDRRRLVIDFNNPRHLRSLWVGSFGFFVLLVGLAAGSVKGFEYTESTEFCGSTCHTMYPQRELHERSPHANVRCADCHIGPGFDHFVRAKIAGIEELVLLATGTYHAPIKSPVEDLRPARETCEECHRPASFQDNIVKIIGHYDDDETNTEMRSTLILKMGGFQKETGISKGIHWHITNQVLYIPADEQRQDIAWVGVRQPDGSLKEYFASDVLGMGQVAFVEEARQNGAIRTFDCIDCHNRAGHYLPYPEEVVDRALSLGLISKEMPFIRAWTVEVFKTKFDSTEAAFAAIDSLQSQYLAQDSRARPAGEWTALVNDSFTQIKKLYTETNFFEMRLDWETNPDNSRHSASLGCFRCHDDQHLTSATGPAQEKISAECTLCHTVPILGRADELLVDVPVIVGSAPESHGRFAWTVEHRSITPAERLDCYACHGQAFCNNGICHNLDHPENMLFTHATEILMQGDKSCYLCHQDVTCATCHEEGIVNNP